MGYAVLSRRGKQLTVLCMGVLSLRSIKNPYQRMAAILREVDRIVETYHPTVLAIEAPFYGKNVQSMLKLGRAQGVAIAAAISRGLEVYEYAPRKIKLAITGKGSASKEQVANMLQLTLRYTAVPESLDATDALACAACHAYQPSHTDLPKGPSTWKEYIAKNPDTVVRH